MAEPMTEAEVYAELDAEIKSLVEGYCWQEVLERMAAVARRWAAEPDFQCPGGTTFSQRKALDKLASTLEELAI